MKSHYKDEKKVEKLSIFEMCDFLLRVPWFKGLKNVVREGNTKNRDKFVILKVLRIKE